MAGLFKGWGDYPPEYNREIHGPYNPSVYYGKRDTPFSEVKIRELGSWFARRNKSPRAFCQAISRAWFRYQLNWIHVKKPSGTFFFQITFLMGLAGMLMDYETHRRLRRFRYH